MTWQEARSEARRRWGANAVALDGERKTLGTFEEGKLSVLAFADSFEVAFTCASLDRMPDVRALREREPVEVVQEASTLLGRIRLEQSLITLHKDRAARLREQLQRTQQDLALAEREWRESEEKVRALLAQAQQVVEALAEIAGEKSE